MSWVITKRTPNIGLPSPTLDKLASAFDRYEAVAMGLTVQ